MSKNLSKPVWWVFTLIEVTIFTVIVMVFSAFIEAGSLKPVWGILLACILSGVNDQVFECLKHAFVKDYER